MRFETKLADRLRRLASGAPATPSRRTGLHDHEPAEALPGIRFALVGVAAAAAAAVLVGGLWVINRPESTELVATDSTGTASVEAPPPEPSETAGPDEDALLDDGDACDPELAAFFDAQFAFVGTVVDVRDVIHPWDVDPENPARSISPEPTRWVTFDVQGWYTNDWGTRFSVWMPLHREGWDAVAAAAGEAAAAWSTAPGDRITHIRITGGGADHDVTTTERDGEVVDVRGVGITDPSTLVQPWMPYTIEGVFDLIDELTGRGEVAAVFDPATGAPTQLFFDPAPSAIDDELTVKVDVTSPTDTTVTDPTSAIEDELRRAGADLAEFPGDLDDLQSAYSCGTLEVGFDDARAALAPIIRCLSDQAQAGTTAAAVFVSWTPEGDPVVELWLVESGWVTIFVDSSRDNFGGGPFAWSRNECTIELPLPEPDAGYPDPSSTFAC